VTLSDDFLFCALAVVAGACLQGVSGIGFALFAAPIVALRQPELIPGPMIVLGGVVSALAAAREFRHLDYRGAALALAGRLPGAVLAGLVIGLLPIASFALVFASLILAAVALSLVGWRVAPTGSKLFAAGFASGFMGTMTSVGTPPMAIVMQHADPERLRATIGAFLALGSVISLTVLAFAGRFGWHELELSAELLAPLALGFWLSSLLIPRLDGKRVRRLALVVCSIAALALIARHA